MKKPVSVLLIGLMLFSLLALAPAASAKSKTPYLNYKTFLMKKGQKQTFKLKNAKNVKWSSSDKKVLTVSKKGVAKAKKAGTAKLTAKYKNKKYTCAVTVSSGKKTSLVVYFSATGTTKSAAGKVKKADKADIFRLVPRTPYTSKDLDYDTDCRANREQNKPSSRPAIATGIKNLKQYSTVYIGYPIWWGKEPRIIRTFLYKYSMKGKTVIPFCTSGSSGISGSMSGIRAGAKKATVKQGKDLTDSSYSAVKKWVCSFKKKNSSKTAKKTQPTVSPVQPTLTPSTEPATEQTAQPATEPVAEKPAEPASESDKTLVVYFSRTGHTKPLAQYAAEYLSADLFEIKAKIPYTDEDIAYYTDCRADREQSDPTARPEISGYVDIMDRYSTIVLAYPIWHGQAPKIIYTFLESYNFSGKTIIPFCTSASSPIGTSDTNLHPLAENASWKEGRRFAIGTDKETICKWIGSMTQTNLTMTINDVHVAVDWENNEAVAALKEAAKASPLTIEMSMYGGFEQVGSLGMNLPSDDVSTTTSPGDIVLYSGNQLVVFYGSNTWAYTRLGKITDKTGSELSQLLSSGNVTIKITY